MALIECPECKKKISDKAISCPNCGMPLTPKENLYPAEDGINVCPKCGHFYDGIKKCKNCNTKMINCNISETEWTDKLLDGSLKQWEKQMREKYVVNSSEFDQNLYNKVIKEEQDEDDYWNEQMKKCPDITVIKCPYCGSTDTKKISTASKIAHTAVWGIFSMSRNSKEWHCNKCGSDF